MRESQYNTWVQIGDLHVVHNGVTGAMARVGGEQRRAIARLLDDPDYEPTGHVDLLTTLVRNRVLVADEADELAQLERTYRRASTSDEAMSLTVVTSLGCNFGCPYCFEAKTPDKLSVEVADAIVGRVESAVGLRSLRTTWFGGEPLLATPELLTLADRLIDHCDRHEIAYGGSIITNGWFLDGPTAASLAERRVDRAQVTLDGPAHVHDTRRFHLSGAPTFDRIVANLAEASEHLAINVRINIDEHNGGDAEALLYDLVDAGLAGKVSVGVSALLPGASNPDAPLASYGGCGVAKGDFARFQQDFAALAASLDLGRVLAAPAPIPTPCTAVNENDLVIGAGGELWKCWDDVGDATKAFGTIFDPVPDARSRRDFVDYDPFADDQCRSCTALPGCMGGCAHLALHSDDRDAQCSTFRFQRHARVEAAALAVLGELTPPSKGLVPPAVRSSPPMPVTLRRRRGSEVALT